MRTSRTAARRRSGASGPARTVLAAGLALALGGCLERVVPGGHAERGYDGVEDPLTLQPVEARAALLQQRFDLVQAR